MGFRPRPANAAQKGQCANHIANRPHQDDQYPARCGCAIASGHLVEKIIALPWRTQRARFQRKRSRTTVLVSLISHSLEIERATLPGVNQTDNQDRNKNCGFDETHYSEPPKLNCPWVEEYDFNVENQK